MYNVYSRYLIFLPTVISYILTWRRKGFGKCIIIKSLTLYMYNVQSKPTASKCTCTLYMYLQHPIRLEKWIIKPVFCNFS